MSGRIDGTRHNPKTMTLIRQIGKNTRSPGVSFAQRTSISLWIRLSSTWSSVCADSSCFCFRFIQWRGFAFLRVVMALLRIFSYSQIVTLTKLPAVNYQRGLAFLEKLVRFNFVNSQRQWKRTFSRERRFECGEAQQILPKASLSCWTSEGSACQLVDLLSWRTEPDSLLFVVAWWTRHSNVSCNRDEDWVIPALSRQQLSHPNCRTAPHDKSCLNAIITTVLAC